MPEWLSLGNLPEAMLPQAEAVASERAGLAARVNQGAMYAFATGTLEAKVAMIADAHARDHSTGDPIARRLVECHTCASIRRALAVVVAIEAVTP